MKILQRPAGAGLTVILGLVALLAGASLVMLRDGGWPWHATISGSTGGATTAEIVDDDGSAYRFTGSSIDAQQWMDRKQDELKASHHLPEKIAAGRVLEPVGVALVVLGLVQLVRRLTRARRGAARTRLSRSS
ncbi:hypothetical protein [Actinoplanes sp. NPDC049681]|uniref:hypothetical protein n=1 Tax=Actinoplanes sp. NPDC049681 TaxID=3363905 RepID=UPI00378936C2